ncbi:MAG: hypothetical protein O6952_04475 [Planctomycetota bacterium]|nr:hypothetical protein [Planctomycetota bacterium]
MPALTKILIGALALSSSLALGDDALKEADRLRRTGTQHLENTLVPGFDTNKEREAGLSDLERARDLYERAGEADPSLYARTEEAIVDINSQLFWARRDKPIDLGDDDEDEPEETSREDLAREAFASAQRYEEQNPRETFRIMARFFEVAKRYIGTAESIQAQEKSFELQNSIIESRKRSLGKGPCEQALDVAFFKESFRAIPDGDLNCLFYFGDLLERHWMDDEASICFEKILSRPKNPFTERSRTRLASARMRSGRMGEARAVLERGANEGEAASHSLLAQISSSEFDRIQNSLSSAREKAIGGGKDSLRVYRKVAEEMRKAKERLPMLPLEKVCSEISRLAEKLERKGSDRGSAHCPTCAPKGAEGGTGASFMTCPTCRGAGKLQKTRWVRVISGRRGGVGRRKQTYWDKCDKCRGNKRIVCRTCAGLTSILDRMTKKEKRGIAALRDELWGKKMLVEADLSAALKKVEKFVIRKKLGFLSHLDAPYFGSMDIRRALAAPPLSSTLPSADADARWASAPGEEKMNFLLSWAVEFASVISRVSFVNHAGARKALSRGSPAEAGDTILGPEEVGAFAEDLSPNFVRVRGKFLDFGEDPDNPYLLRVDVQSRFAHVLEFYVWKDGAQRSLEGLAGLYGMSTLKELVLAYDFTTEQKARLLDRDRLVRMVGRVIPGAPTRFEIWAIEEG